LKKIEKNPITGGGGGTVADNKTNGLLDTEARKERIADYDTDIEAARKGTLTEDAKAKDAKKIKDAGKGTKTTIAGRLPEGFTLTPPLKTMRYKTGAKPPEGYVWAYKGSERIAVPKRYYSLRTNSSTSRKAY
jgi:hypothetical protein